MRIRILCLVILAGVAGTALGQSVSSIVIGGGGATQPNGHTTLAGQTFVANLQLSGKSLLLGAPNCWLAEGGGGGGCNGQEVVAKATCATKNGTPTKVVVLIKGATPGQSYTAVLDTGQSVTSVSGDRGKVKFLFKGANKPPCGPNGATVCGKRKDFTCACP